MKHPCRNSSVRHRTSHTMMTMIFTHYVALNNQHVFSFLRTLSAWHCSHSHAGRRAAVRRAAIDPYLLPDGFTAANLQERVCCCCRPILGQTGGRTPGRFIDPACSTYYAGSANREQKCADTTGTVPVPWAGHFQIPTLKY